MSTIADIKLNRRSFVLGSLMLGAASPLVLSACSSSNTGGSSGGGGGGSTGSGSWTAVERYYLRLMNCTRTGGWVTSTGKCSSPGGRDAAPTSAESKEEETSKAAATRRRGLRR